MAHVNILVGEDEPGKSADDLHMSSSLDLHLTLDFSSQRFTISEDDHPASLDLGRGVIITIKAATAGQPIELLGSR